MKYFSNSSLETQKLAANMASQLKGGEVLCLYGNLGSGKTTFATGLIQYFLPKNRVLSPTFIIVRHYKISSGEIRNIFHLDLYRIDNARDLSNIGFEQMVNHMQNIILIEWPQKAQKLLPKKKKKVYFNLLEENKRMIEII